MNMSRIKTISAIWILFLATSIFGSSGNPQTTANNPVKAAQGENTQTMQVLLNEVRQLRIAIQQSNLSVYRAQVILERSRSQQQRVDRLAERLRETRDRMANWKMGQSEMQDELKMLEGRINRATEVAERTNLEEHQERLKTRLASMAQENTRLLEQESQLAAQLNIEQARLTELNDQLDALQRELETPPVENRPPQDGKRP
jgi:chromosome segregation ATPase